MADQTTGKAGVRAEIAAAASEAVAAGRADGEQLSLLMPPIPAVDAKGRKFDVAAMAAGAEARRGPGRPRGAENRATKELRRYLLERGTNPAEWLVRWLAIRPDELAKYLGCTVLEAFREQRIVAAEIRKVFVPDLASTDDAGQAVPLLNLNIDAMAGGADGSDDDAAEGASHG